MTRLCLKLTFLGTRGNIQIRSARHRRHTSLLVSYRGEDVLVDCGQDWLDEIDALNPSANVLTHAHPDHVGGLARGSPSAVYATADVWRAIGSWPIHDRGRLGHRSPSVAWPCVERVEELSQARLPSDAARRANGSFMRAASVGATNRHRENGENPTSELGLGVAGNVAFYNGSPDTTRISSLVANMTGTSKQKVLV